MSWVATPVDTRFGVSAVAFPDAVGSGFGPLADGRISTTSVMFPDTEVTMVYVLYP